MASHTRFTLCVLLMLGLAFVSSLTEDGRPFGKRVLVLLDDLKTKQTHSIFFNDLQARGYKLSFHAADDTIEFRKYGVWNYDNLILFAPEASELSITVNDVLEFIDSGRNVLIAANSNLADPVREIASECNVEFDDEETFVIDHFNFDTTDANGPRTLIVADNFVKDAPVVLGKDGISAPVLFRGVGQDIEEDSQLLFSVLSGAATAYSANPKEAVDEVHVAGQKTVLFSVLQARNNARVGFSGSLDMFSDKFINSAVQKYTAEGTSKKFNKAGNEEFLKQVTSWIFQERGILRARNVHHHKSGESTTSATYTIKDNVTYSIEIDEYDGATDKFVPFKGKDVQLEYRMLDPYVRANLKGDNGKFTHSFTLPDVYGVFTFKVEYVRKGYGFLTSITRVPVRPFRHDQYERFIASAMPYYAGAISMLGGLFLFSWVFLYHREKK